MAFHSILLEQTKMEESSILSEAKITRRNRPKRDFSGSEDDTKKRGKFSLLEGRPAKRLKGSEIKKNTSGIENDSLSVAPDNLEFEIHQAKLDILSYLRNMIIRMENEDKLMTREMKIWTRGGLDNIHDGKSPQNEFFIVSLIDNFEKTIENHGQESREDLNYTMDSIRKILVKLVKRIDQSFRQKPCIDAVKVKRRYTANFLWIGLWSLVAVLIGIFPDYLLKFFEYAVAYYQSTILLFFLFCILYFYNPDCK